MEESFTLEDIEQREMDEIASTPNTDSITVCLCRGVCLRESGRNACPCKSCGQFCSSACHEENQICLTNLQSVETDSSESDSSEGDLEVCDHYAVYTLRLLLLSEQHRILKDANMLFLHVFLYLNLYLHVFRFN